MVFAMAIGYGEFSRPRIYAFASKALTAEAQIDINSKLG